MDAGTYTNRGEEVALGMECALPFLAHCTRSPNGERTERTNPTLYLVKQQHRTAALERLAPVHS